MSSSQAVGLTVAQFRDDEPVGLSLPELLPDAVQPCFGDTVRWNFNGVTRRPANKAPHDWQVRFDAFNPAWNLRVRELSTTWFNPQHPRVIGCGIHLPPLPLSITTVRARLSGLRRLAKWAADMRLHPAQRSGHCSCGSVARRHTLCAAKTTRNPWKRRP